MIHRYTFLLVVSVILPTLGNQIVCGATSPSGAGAAASTINRAVSLLTVEYPPGTAIGDPQQLVRYRFSAGRMFSREVVLMTATRVCRYDLGRNRIYRNRYVITHWGDCIDVEAKKLLHQSQVEELVDCDGDQVILQSEKDGHFLLNVYNLKSNRYRPLDLPSKWALVCPHGRRRAVLSSDSTKSVCCSPAGELRLRTLDGKESVLGRGFHWERSVLSSTEGEQDVPLLWLDEQRILTQRRNGELVIVRLDGSVQPVVSIPVRESPSQMLLPPKIYRNVAEQVTYDCGQSSWTIDVKNSSYESQPWLILGHGFEVKIVAGTGRQHILRYRGREIGCESCRVYESPSAEQYLAVTYGLPADGHDRPRGFKVWNAVSGQWAAIDPPWIECLVGWIEDTACNAG